ncbi:hypothetical protein MNBD_GAMMA16-1377 [hydrothermal vent metagenome]|uniref:Porin domain-containing protein n=1 Tax=hydrothermal vent metagenome TaxID=652676 RepID=A0A3B0YS05_9ZZZZ
MKRNLITPSIIAILTTPLTAGAIEIAGEKLDVYGKIHVSIDYSDRDDPSVSNDGMSISSNSSRLGFKGKLPLENGMKVIWQFEQEVRWDDSSTGNFANRNSYVGLASGANNLRVGVYDTPFKTVASKWGLFGDSVGERRGMLGAGYDSGNQLNERVKNSVMYQFENETLNVQAMYAVEPEDTSGAVDDNDKSMFGLGVWWNFNSLTLSAAYEDWTKHSAIDDGTAFRVAAVYGLGDHQLGALYENIDSDTVDEWKRNAFGINWKWQFIECADLRAQYIMVDDADNSPSTAATKISLGVFHKLDKNAEVYVAYATTDNDDNAKFQGVDGGHGDEVKTVNGGSPSSFSLGMVYKF